MTFRNVMLTIKIAMGLPKRQFAGPGLSLSVTPPTLRVPRVITNQTPGARRCQRKFVLQTTATWFRYKISSITSFLFEIHTPFNYNPMLE